MKISIIAYSSAGLMLVVLSTLLLAPIIMPAFGYNSTTFNDTFKSNVTVSNAAPGVSTVSFDDNDSYHSTIALSAGSTTNYVMCNATVTDPNGWGDFASPGNVNATFWLTTFSNSSSNFSSSNDTNYHYVNSSCALVSGSGNTAIATCVAPFEYEALNGTWNCTITAMDQSGSTASNSTTNTVDQLVAVSVAETSIHFGTLATDKNSTTANTTNETNLGNVKIDLTLVGTDMPCTGVGTIGVGNISFNVTSGGYDTMVGNKLSTAGTSLTAFNLNPRGITPFGDATAATNLSYWTIHVPSGVRGECTNNITVVALLSAD